MNYHEDEAIGSAMMEVNQKNFGPQKFSKRSRLETLYDLRSEFQKRLIEVNEAIEALENNPAVLNVLEKLDKVGRL